MSDEGREPHLVVGDLRTAIAQADAAEVAFKASVDAVKGLHAEFLTASAKLHDELAAQVRWS